MSRITDRNAQMMRWLNRLFLPSAPTYTDPNDIDTVIKLVAKALPPSVLFERLGFFGGTTVNPATQLFCPSALLANGVDVDYTPGNGNSTGVPLGRFLWVLGASFNQTVLASTTAGRAFLGIKPVGAITEIPVGSGFFSTTSLNDFASNHSIQAGSAVNTMAGGGTGPFIVPPGYHLHFSTAAVPGATTLYHADICLVECIIGEEIPGSV